MVAGGSNHDGGLSSAEYWDEDAGVWRPLGSPLPLGLRSAGVGGGGLAWANGVPALLGGAECAQDADTGRSNRCARRDKITHYR